MLEFAFSFLFAVDEEPACAAGSELAGLIGGELIADVDFALGQLITRRDGVEFQTQKALSGYLSATSSACEKSSSRLYNSHLSLFGFHLSGANRASVGGSSFHGIRSGRQHAIQPSLYMARFPRISKYCCVWRDGALALSNVERKLTPCIGI